MNRYPITIFSLLCLAIALPFFLCIYFFEALQYPQNLAALPCWLGMVWSPTLSAIIMRKLRGEMPVVWSQLKSPGAPGAWLLAGTVLLVGLAMLIQFYAAENSSMTDDLQKIDRATWLMIALLLPLLHWVMGPLGEELGWRGFALPLLLKRGLHPLLAALLVGLIWAGWHLPLWLLDAAPQAQIPVYIFWAHVLCYSILFTIVYLYSQGSIWPAIVLHLLLNYSGDLVCLVTGLENSEYYTHSLPGFMLLAMLGGVLLILKKHNYDHANQQV